MYEFSYYVYENEDRVSVKHKSYKVKPNSLGIITVTILKDDVANLVLNTLCIQEVEDD